MQVHRGGFFLPLIAFAGFAIERVESDPQRTCSAEDFFLSRIFEFSPPPRLQHMTSPTPSCQISAKVHPAFRNQVGNESLDHFYNGEKSVVLFSLAGEQLTSRKSFEWHCSGQLPKITYLLSMDDVSQKAEPLKSGELFIQREKLNYLQFKLQQRQTSYGGYKQMQRFLISLCLGQFAFGLCTTGHRLICSEESFGLCSIFLL